MKAVLNHVFSLARQLKVFLSNTLRLHVNMESPSENDKTAAVCLPSDKITTLKYNACVVIY